MSLAQRDYLLRVIQQLAQAIAAILARKREGKLDEALSMIEAQRRALFGPMREAIDRLDAPSVATLLGTADKVRAYALLLAVEADVRAERDDPRAVARLRRRALDVHLEGVARFPALVGAEDRAAILVLAAAVGEGHLTEAARATLAALRRPID